MKAAHDGERYVPPANLHPAALPATSLHAVLALAGLEVTTESSDDSGGHRPFLSIVTRTQGRRPQCLEDMLTCLAGQTVRDFEVVLMCHQVDESSWPVPGSC